MNFAYVNYVYVNKYIIFNIYFYAGKNSKIW